MKKSWNQTEILYSARAHREELLCFLDRLLYAAFMQKRGMDYENLSMRGLVITEREIEQAFGMLHKKRELPGDETDSLLELGERIRENEKKAGESLPFSVLCRTFGLTPLERLALLLGSALAWDRKYEKIYGFLQDQVEQTVPTRGLCLSLAELLGEPNEEEVREFLNGEGSLELLLEPGREPLTGLKAPAPVRPRIFHYLDGSLEPEECLRGRIETYTWMESLPPMLIRRELLESLENLLQRLEREETKEACMILLYGKAGIGKRFLLRHLAANRKLRLLFADISSILYEKEEIVRQFMDSLLLESVLLRAVICLTNGDCVQEMGEEKVQRRQDRRREILEYLKFSVPYFFLLCEEKEEQAADFTGRRISIELPSLTAKEKISLWEVYASSYSLGEDVDPEQNGNKYILTPGEIQAALSTAELLAFAKNRTALCQEDIRLAVKQNQKNQLGFYASLISSNFVWEDLILGEEQKRQMRMVCNQLKYRDIVGEEWGFHQKTPYGRGLSVLFYGPPGTGKTMAAQVMARELGLDLYRIDISQMVSKYIGETQKNISNLFKKAKDINAILFFDEADSLFAKRSEAKDSHDRNANAETAHLLQKLEDYEGIAILATNYLNNIDDAFKRRLKFIIHIAFPDKEVRKKLWRSTLPARTRCEEELDFEFFAEHFELSGSGIKEILTNAAYLAAAEHRGLCNRDLVEAVKLNYAKYGKILTKQDFEYLG